MPTFTVNPDGSIVVQTAQQAVEIQQEILARKAGRPAPAAQSKARPQLSEPSRVMARLREYDGQKIEAANLCRVIGVDTPKAVGTKMRHLEKAFRAQGIDLHTILPSHSGANGLKRWTVRLPKENGSLV